MSYHTYLYNLCELSILELRDKAVKRIIDADLMDVFDLNKIKSLNCSFEELVTAEITFVKFLH